MVSLDLGLLEPLLLEAGAAKVPQRVEPGRFCPSNAPV